MKFLLELAELAAQTWFVCAGLTILGSLIWPQVRHFIWRMRSGEYGVWRKPRALTIGDKVIPLPGGWEVVHGGADYVGTYAGAKGYASYCNMTRLAGSPYVAKRYRKV